MEEQQGVDGDSREGAAKWKSRGGSGGKRHHAGKIV